MVDECIVDKKVVVEINGCYHHACPVCYAGKELHPSQLKGPANDKRKRSYLKSHGWKLVEVWEHEWASDPAACIRRVLAAAAS